ncbi:MAG: 3-deoxy-manno-octulosonate cytidylyltransferase [Candidatus Hydrogenedentota bacterium]
MAAHKVLAVIPARFASTRFPGKVMAPIGGKPLVWHTFQRALKATLVSDVVVATDDERVAGPLRDLHVPVVLTRPDHPSGTDRISEVANGTTADLIVNVQGDEPLIDPHTIDAAVEVMLDDESLSMSTARRLLIDNDDILNPNVVKVVCDSHGKALYFSRSPIPHIRDSADRECCPPCYWQHIGLYVYRRSFLLEFAKWQPTTLEKLEKLEQLRVLEHGHAIGVIETSYKSIGVDTPEDLERVRVMIEHIVQG